MPRGFCIKEKYSHELNELIACCIFKGGNPYIELFYQSYLILLGQQTERDKNHGGYPLELLFTK